MSAKREKRRRYALRIEYAYALSYWLKREPPKILFWRYRKWKKSRPVFNKRADPYRLWLRPYPGMRW